MKLVECKKCWNWIGPNAGHCNVCDLIEYDKLKPKAKKDAKD